MPIQKTSESKRSKPSGGKRDITLAEPQAAIFDKAMDLFNARNFKEALDEFEVAANGSSADIAHSARLHMRMCELRLRSQTEEPQTAEDRYNVAVAHINRRELAQARVYLEAALNAAPQAGHLHYAMALLCGLEGNIAAAAQALSQAIQLDSSNRNAARNDPDFHDILRHAEIRTVLDKQGATTA